MGCGDSASNRPPMTVEQQFMELGLAPRLQGTQNWNQQERDIFMAINVCRARPAAFSQIVHMVK